MLHTGFVNRCASGDSRPARSRTNGGPGGLSAALVVRECVAPSSVGGLSELSAGAELGNTFRRCHSTVRGGTARHRARGPCGPASPAGRSVPPGRSARRASPGCSGARTHRRPAAPAGALGERYRPPFTESVVGMVGVLAGVAAPVLPAQPLAVHAVGPDEGEHLTGAGSRSDGLLIVVARPSPLAVTSWVTARIR
jgi:hypothetical protein